MAAIHIYYEEEGMQQSARKVVTQEVRAFKLWDAVIDGRIGHVGADPSHRAALL